MKTNYINENKLKDKNKKGMTLVEIIISITLLGILAVSFLPAFVSGFKMIIHNGNILDNMYQSQDVIEEKISQGTTSTTDTMTISFPSTGKVINVKGEKVTDGQFRLFIPKK